MDYILFVKDTVGDIEAAKYGGPAKEKVPRFRRAGAGRVLGLDAGLRIVHGSLSGQVEIASGGRKRARYIDSNAQFDTLSRSRRRVKTDTSQTKSLNSGSSFVPFATSKRKEQENEGNTYLGHEFAGTNKKATSPEQSDDGGRSASSDEESSDKSAISPQDELQERLKMLDNKVRADGGDITSWLALVDIQEEVVEMEMAVNQDRTKGEKRGFNVAKSQTKILQSIVEVKMSVLERASRANPSNAASLALTLAKLELAASNQVWDSDRTEREWRKAIVSFSSSWDAFVQLWNNFLTWKMKNGDNFIMKEMLQTFAEALLAFRAAFFQENNLDEREAKEIAALKLIKWAIDMLLQAGYLEQAHGIIQALSELTFRRPLDLSIDTEESFQSSCTLLKDYWDLEEYRMGETASVGWCAFQERVSKDPQSISKIKSVEEITSMSFGTFPKELDDPDPVVRWFTLERARADLRQFSAKEIDEADWTTGELEVDPFSVVLFSDVAPFLVPIMSSQGKDILVSIIMSTLGVTCGISGESSMFMNHYFAGSGCIWPSHLGQISHTRSWEIIGGEIMQRPRTSALSDPFKIPIKAWPVQLDTLFPIQVAEKELWFASWETPPKDKAMKANSFLEQIHRPSTAVALARLGLSEVSQSHKAVKKLAKLLLNQDRDNVVLWRAFARLERNNGNLESARTVYMSLLVADHPAKELTPAWSDLAEMEWEAGDFKTSLLILTIAAKCLFASSEVSALTSLKQQMASTMDILRTRRIFDQMLSSPDCNHHTVFCAALFTYLSLDPDEAFESAMAVFHKQISVKNLSELSEDIAMTHCKFIWRHIYGNIRMKRSRAYTPSRITAILLRYVLDFPHNSAFVSLLAAFEMTTKVENVLRGVLEDKLQRSKDMASEYDWLVYLHCELHMNLHSVNENAVRRLFERALQSKRTSASSLLWQLYLQFEVKLCQRKVTIFEASRARAQCDEPMKELLKDTIKSEQRQCKASLIHIKSIFYRAIQNVPYCKALYLIAFSQPLRQVFPLDELLQLSQVMQEKDLRLYTDFTAFVTPSD